MLLSIEYLRFVEGMLSHPDSFQLRIGDLIAEPTVFTVEVTRPEGDEPLVPPIAFEALARELLRERSAPLDHSGLDDEHERRRRILAADQATQFLMTQGMRETGMLQRQPHQRELQDRLSGEAYAIYVWYSCVEFDFGGAHTVLTELPPFAYLQYPPIGDPEFEFADQVDAALQLAGRPTLKDGPPNVGGWLRSYGQHPFAPSGVPLVPDIHVFLTARGDRVFVIDPPDRISQTDCMPFLDRVVAQFTSDGGPREPSSPLFLYCPVRVGRRR